jgi:hypothetical protein
MIEGDRAIFAVEASHKIWALTSRLEIPPEHITGAQVDPDPAMGWFDGLKVAGTGIPHVSRAGTFFLHGELVFYDVRNPQKTIVVGLASVEVLRTALAKHRFA